MRPLEKVAVLTAMKKAVEDSLKEARKEADCDLMEAYDDMGVEKLAIKLGGEKVGEFVVTFAKEGFEIYDSKAFEDFALDYGMAHVKREIRPDMMESCIRALEDVFTSETLAEAVQETVVIHSDWEKAMENVGGGVQYMDSGLSVPGVRVRPKRIKGTMVRGCEPEKVIPIANKLPETAALLLGGTA